jgi:hypothetical protein
MIRFVFLTSLFLFISGCSFQTPPNNWQYKSSNAFESYTKNFLQDHTIMAKNDLSRAQEHARMSADLTMLARIYLGKCALNIAVGVEDHCQEYLELQALVQDNSLQAYYALLQKNTNAEHITQLPKQYQDFANALYAQKYTKAFDAIVSLEPISSQLIAASLIKSQLTDLQREKMIDIASFYGYKKAVLFWLQEAKNSATNLQKVQEIETKITILQKGTHE